jgi:hypothetical protein
MAGEKHTSCAMARPWRNPNLASPLLDIDESRRCEPQRIVRICRDGRRSDKRLGGLERRVSCRLPAGCEQEGFLGAGLLQSAEADRPMSANWGLHAGRLIGVCRALVPTVYPKVNLSRDARQSKKNNLVSMSSDKWRQDCCSGVDG